MLLIRDVIVSAVGVLDTLNLNMDHKAKSFESPFLAGLFLLNNFQYILRSFTRSVSGSMPTVFLCVCTFLIMLCPPVMLCL